MSVPALEVVDQTAGITLRVHGAACGVRGLWSIIQDINAVLSGKRSHGQQQYGPAERQYQQVFHRFSLCCRWSEAQLSTTPSGYGIGSNQFVPKKMK
jgi:hypothetical protein